MRSSDPTQETRTSIVLLRLSNTRPSGTWKTPLMSIQVNAGAKILDEPKIKQLHPKLPSTAATDRKLLNALNRRVNRVIAIAETSGRSNAHHGSKLFMSI